MKLVAENLGHDLNTLQNYEVEFVEGDIGEVRFYLDRLLYQGELDQLEYELCQKGVALTAPTKQDARILIIKFRKAIIPLAIIAGAIGTAGVSIAGWQLYKKISEIPIWVWVAGGLAVGYLFFRMLR